MSIAALQARINRLIELIEPRQAPRTWFFLVKVGRELPAHIRATFGPGDTVVIREVPAEFTDMVEDYHPVGQSEGYQ